MAEYNAETVKKLAADLYGAGNIAARDYGEEYTQLAEAEALRQNQAAEAYREQLGALENASTAAYERLGTQAEDLSRIRLDRQPEQRTENGGGIYGTAGAELTESAKILHDNALGNAINDIRGAQKSEEDELELMERIAEYQRQQNVYQGLADLEQQQIAAQRAENQAAAWDILNANTSLDSILSRAYGLQQSEDALAEAQAQNAYNNAITEVNTFGKVMTKAAAEALGVPIGTSAAYAKVNLVKSSGSGSGGSSGTGSNSGLTDEDYARVYDALREDGRDHAYANQTVKAMMKANGESESVTKELTEYMYAVEQNALKNTFANSKTTTTAKKTVDWQK